MSTRRQSTTKISARSPKAFAVSTICAAAAMCISQSAFAAVEWSRAAGNPGDINDGANWTGGSVPINLDALINNGGIATAAGPNVTFSTFGLATLPGTSGTVQQSAGVITSTGNMSMGEVGSTSSLYSISGGTLSVGFGVGTGQFFVGAAGPGTLNISGNGVVAVKSYLRLGNADAGAGTLLMSGGSLTVTDGLFRGWIYVGDNAVGTASISAGTITTRYLVLGQSTNGAGHVTQTGGYVNATLNMVMGEQKPLVSGNPQKANDYTMSAGAIAVGNELYIGAHGPSTFSLSGTGSITVGGTVHIGASDAVNDPPQGLGTLSMSGGTINVTGANAHFVIGDGGLGTMNLSGGSITTKFYNVGQNPGATGVVSQSGGKVTANYDFVVGETSQNANSYDLSGGSVVVLQDALVPTTGEMYLGSSNGAGSMKVRGTGSLSVAVSAHLGGGASSAGTLDVGGGTVTLGTNGLGTGVLIVGDNGVGTFKLSGGVVNTPAMTVGQNTTATGVGTQTGGSLLVGLNFSIGEAATSSNVYDISAGTLSVGSAIFLGTTGVGTLKIGGTAIVTTGAIQNATTGSGTIVVSGGTLTSSTTHNVGLYSQTGGVASLGVIDSAGQIQISSGTISAASIAQGTLLLSGTARVNVLAGGGTAGTSIVGSLSVAGSAKLDLADHDLVVDYTGTSPLSSIQSAIVSGYAIGAWNGNGINSSAAAASSSTAHKMALGYAEASAAGFANATFSGKSIDADAVLVKYTYAGDSNLDGTVSSTDFNNLTASYGASGKAWIQGDFDYNGKVNTLDFNLLAGNFGQTLPAPSLGSVVPEPAALSLLGIASAGLLRRRIR